MRVLFALIMVLGYLSGTIYSGDGAPIEPHEGWWTANDYIDIIKRILDAEVLQPYFYRLPDGTPYPVTIVEGYISSIPDTLGIHKFGYPVRFLTYEAADSIDVPSYFMVADFVQDSNSTRIQLYDTIRNILLGAGYRRTPDGWEIKGVRLAVSGHYSVYDTKTYAEILRLTLDEDTLQPYFYRLPDGSVYPVAIADEVISSSSDKLKFEKFGLPVKFRTKEMTDNADLKAYFWVVDYEQYLDKAGIELYDPKRRILFGAEYIRLPDGWQRESVNLELDADFPAYVETYTEILRLSLEADILQGYFYKSPDGTPYPVTIADEILSGRSDKPQMEKFGKPVRIMSKDAADSADLPAYFWVSEYSQSRDNAFIELEDPLGHMRFGVSYIRMPTGWRLDGNYMETFYPAHE